MSEVVELKENKENGDIVITLVNKEGEKVDFVEFARVEYNGETYAILQPVKLFDNMKEDEAFVFKVTQDENNADKYDIQVDDEIVNGVFSEYYRLLDEEEAQEAKK
ncbi:MAG: DUF1292 domain-containing protein [bacterium]|nr:DUF1292 domain-containing protein [bacterium]